MSCALNKLLSIRNISGIIEWLQLDGEGQEGTAWDIKWDDWDSSQDKKIEKTGHEWLEKCLFRVSSMGNVAVIAHKNCIVILTASELFEEDDNATLSVRWKGTVGNIEGDEITDALCLPIASQNRSMAGTPDFTCIIIGFKSGFVSVYSEDGTLLLSQQFDESPVVKVNCRTYTFGEFGIPLHADLSLEFVVAYQKYVISIDGKLFLDTLRLCRKRAAKESAGSVDLSSVPPLKHVKYSLDQQDKLISCVSGGSLALHLYDKLVQESSLKGFCDHVGLSVASRGHLLTVGEMPYFGIIELGNENSHLQMRDIAYDIAFKVKDRMLSAATDWLFPHKEASPQEPAKPKFKRLVPASFRTFLPDGRRVGTSIALSAGRRLAAVTDTFGRVVVIDVVRGITLRMWKGYRDAECGWQEVVDDWGGEKRKVTFLVIYAPRRGLLEVWLPQQGPRIAAFNVSKQARLLYAHHIVLGFAGTMYEAYHSYPVLLLTPDGVLESIHIPFHLALSSKSDRQARDQHLLKELRKYLYEDDEDSVITLVKKLETVYGKFQFIQMLTNHRKYSLFLMENVLEIFFPANEQAETDVAPKRKDGPSAESDYGSHEFNKLMVALKRMRRLIDFYKYVTIQEKDTGEVSVGKNNEKKIFARLLRISEDDVDSLPVLMSEESSAKEVNCEKKETVLDFYSFVSCFAIAGRGANYSGDIPICTHTTIASTEKEALTDLIFAKMDTDSLERVLSAIEASGIDILLLVEVFYDGFYSRKEHSLASAKKLSLALIGLFFLYGDFTEEANISTLWLVGMNLIFEWSEIPCAHLIALITRGIEQSCVLYLHEVLKISTMEDVPGWEVLYNGFVNDLNSEHFVYTSLNEWEHTEPRIVEWNIFIDRVSSLTCMYNIFHNDKSYYIPYAVSVKSVMNTGSDCISALMAKYIARKELSSTSLMKILCHFSDPIEISNVPVNDADDDYVTPIQEIRPPLDELEPDLRSIYDDIAAVKEKFPISLDNESILCNICWEYIRLWDWNLNKTKYLTLMVDLFKSLDYTETTIGTAILIWNTHLVEKILPVTKYIEKHGCVSFDELRSSLSIDSKENLLINFTEYRRFFTSILKVKRKGKSTKERSTIPDQLWNHSNKAGLSDTAFSAYGELSEDRFLIHMELLDVIIIILHSGITNARITDLFSEEQHLELLQPLVGEITYTEFMSVRPSMLRFRIEFLCRIITMGVMELPDSFDDDGMKRIPDFLIMVDALGNAWGCEADIFRKHYILELMYSGFDNRARDHMKLLSFMGDLPDKVFLICGLRLKYLIDTLPGEKLMILLASTSAMVSQWTRRLDKKSVLLRNPKVPMSNVKMCMTAVQNYVDTMSDNYFPGICLLGTIDGMIKDGF